jgi:hypothetical protein
MPEGKIDFASGQKSADEPLGGAIPQSVNVLVDAVGAIHLRPGIATWDGFEESPLYDEDTTVDGITVWKTYPVWVTSDRLIHALVGGVGTDLSDTTAATQLDGGARPVLAPTRDMVVLAGGGLLQKWEGPGSALSERLGGSPPAATHVVATAQRLVVNPNGLTGQIQWSEAGDYETWLGEFDEMESKPDSLPALYESTGELVCGGTETVEVGKIEFDTAELANFFNTIRTWSGGFGAPYSFAANDETFGFLDNRLRIQLTNGRSFAPISDKGITGTLQEMAKVAAISDCWGFRAQIDGWNLLAWHFPTAARTFVYDLDRQSWSEWRGYSAGQWVAWAGKSVHFWQDEKLHLVGLGDGTIGKLNAGTVTDNGEPIVGEVYSGFQDRGTSNWKQHITTRFAFRRGIGDGTAPGPRCQLFWRDSTGAWEEPYELDLGQPDDPTPVIEVRSLGTYKMRQWRLRFSDSVPVVFVGAVETFEVLET